LQTVTVTFQKSGPYPYLDHKKQIFFLNVKIFRLYTINYGSGSVSDFLTSYGSGSSSTSQKVTVPTFPVPVPQHSFQVYQ
jgi:hypothetical protein